MFIERQNLSKVGLENEIIKENIFVNEKKKIMYVFAINLNSNILQILVNISFYGYCKLLSLQETLDYRP